MAVLDDLVDPKIVKILKTLQKHRQQWYHIHKLARMAKVPVGSTFRITKKLVTQGYIDTMEVDAWKLYRYGKAGNIKELNKLIR